MIRIITLILTLFIILLLLTVLVSSFIKKHSIIGKPPIPSFLFLLAKIFAFTNVFFLLRYGLNHSIPVLYNPPAYLQYIGLAFLTGGCVLIFLTTSILKKDLIFGLPSTEKHTLQLKGVFGISRHPFYLGFLLVLASSILLVPNLINILFFIPAWLLHHFIMMREEEFLVNTYGDAYREYMKRVRRYF